MLKNTHTYMYMHARTQACAHIGTHAHTQTQSLFAVEQYTFIHTHVPQAGKIKFLWTAWRKTAPIQLESVS